MNWLAGGGSSRGVRLTAAGRSGLPIDQTMEPKSYPSTMTIEEAIQAKEQLLRTFADAANAFSRATGLTIAGMTFTALEQPNSAPRYVFDADVKL